MDKIPMCWKCVNAKTEPDMYFEGAKVLTGCRKCDMIKSYDDAKTMCPLLPGESND